ncbi:MAG: hypothetical protein L0Y72_23720 [Gemmataceae bacterium]|nr:hypothetical protein [Gemmataceae bacterium]
MRIAAVHFRVFQLVIDMPAIRFKNDSNAVGRQASISALRIQARDLERFIAGQAFFFPGPIAKPSLISVSWILTTSRKVDGQETGRHAAADRSGLPAVL